MARFSRTKVSSGSHVLVRYTGQPDAMPIPSPAAPTDLSGEPEREQVLQPVTDGVGGKVRAAVGHGSENVSRVG